MLDALVEGDEAAARNIARRLVDEGSGVIDVIQDTVVPPLVEIGRRWHDGELSIWVEHRASAIVERMLGELAPNPRGRRRGTVAVAALTGDLHALPTSMAAVALRDDNWNVHHLGANMPPEELHRFCRDHGVDVVVLSSTNPDVVEATHRVADELRAEGTATLVGAPGDTLSDLVGAVREAAQAG
jgi:methanogenic corrinoid protein MtbC1